MSEVERLEQNCCKILQQLYDSEINFSISTFWDGGFDWKLGCEWNGFSAMGCTRTMTEAVGQLEAAAHLHYPNSAFHLGEDEFNRRYKQVKP